MSELIRVDPRYPGAWSVLSRYLQEALERGGGDKDWSVDDIYSGVVSGHLALWAMIKDDAIFGGGVTCVQHYPKRKVLEILAMGADQDSPWGECLEKLAVHAQEMGLTAIIGTGRAGWARHLGAKERRVFEIDLTEV